MARTPPGEITDATMLAQMRSALLEERWGDAVAAWMEYTGEIVDGSVEGTTPVGKVLVTMALDGPSVERVVFAAEYGRLWLTSEPMDATEGGTVVQSLAEVYK